MTITEMKENRNARYPEKSRYLEYRYRVPLSDQPTWGDAAVSSAD